MTEKGRAYRVLALNTLAFTVCFAAWVIYGVLATFLVDNGVFPWDKAQMGWLIGIPVLTGSVMRLPLGVLTDRYGGRTVFTALMLVAAFPMYLVSYANSYAEFLLAGLGFGLAGAGFAVGVAYTSIWFPANQQGTALGIFGMGNAGSALTSMGAPIVLQLVTENGAHLDGWRTLPQLYALALVLTAVVFWLSTYSRTAELGQQRSLKERLAPLQHVRVWRFGLYYFFVFGGFVALAQWLIPYYVNVYSLSVASAGLMAAAFSLPAGVVRALGGWLSDRLGARAVMYWVLGSSIIALILLFPPRMEVQSPGEGVTAERPGTVTRVSAREVVVGDRAHRLIGLADGEERGVRVKVGIHDDGGGLFVFPTAAFWHEPVVKVGDTIEKGELLARGVTHVYFQANVWIFTGLVLLLGLAMGMGAAAVFKHIPSYFPTGVGVVGGIVGVLGGLGGFFNPIVFGYMLRASGIWTTCWMLLAVVGLICLIWMHLVIQRLMRQKVPALIRQIENVPGT